MSPLPTEMYVGVKEPPPPPPPTPTPTPELVIEGAKLTKRTPKVREGDTILGKIMGYLQEGLWFMQLDNLCFYIDMFFPDYFPFDIVQNLLIDIVKKVYEVSYQKSYNLGADRGNHINQEILGWLQELKNLAFAKVDEAQKYIESNLIAPINRLIENELKPKLKQLGIDVSTLETDVGKALSEVSNMRDAISGFEGKINAFASKINAFEGKLNDLSSFADSLTTKLEDAENKLNEHTSSIQDLIARVQALEKGEPPFKLPDIFKS